MGVRFSYIVHKFNIIFIFAFHVVCYNINNKFGNIDKTGCKIKLRGNDYAYL